MLELRQTFDADFTAHDYAPELTPFASEPLAPAPVQPEGVDLEMPRWIWGAMALCYGIFFAGLIAATGHDGEALFAIAISLGYTAMYFGTAGLMFGLKPPRQKSAFARGLAPLKTWTGPMDTTAVAAQVLTVPACLALFGVAVGVIRALVI